MFFNRMETNMNPASMSDEALLSALIGKHSAKALAEQPLVDWFKVTAQPPGDQLKLMVARELVTRYLEAELKTRPALGSPKDVESYLVALFADQEHETFQVLFLSNQNRLVASEAMFRGTLSQTALYPREVVKRALFHNAGAVICAHNHPSGVAEPSTADQLLTKALKNALALVDVRTLDHFVVTHRTCVSFAERGWL